MMVGLHRSGVEPKGEDFLSESFMFFLYKFRFTGPENKLPLY